MFSLPGFHLLRVIKRIRIYPKAPTIPGSKGCHFLKEGDFPLVFLGRRLSNRQNRKLTG